MDAVNKNIIAAIDMGTNSFHLIIASVQKDGAFRILDRERVVIRLGSEQGNNLNHISENETNRSVSVLQGFIKKARQHNAHIRTVTTSAVREADNRDEFLLNIFRRTGIKVEVIDGRREAGLIYLGMERSLRISESKVLCIDIGGGSTEFIYSVNGSIIFAESVKIGAVRLAKKFFPRYVLNDDAVKLCGDHAEQQIISNSNIKSDIQIDYAVGSSGTVDTVFFITQFRKYGKIKDELNGYEFSRADFSEVYNYLTGLRSPEERMAVPGLEPRRADIIPAGMIILRKIFDLFGICRLKISDYALREGIVFDTYAKLNS